MGFFRNAASVFATNLAALPIGLATTVVLARCLSVEDRGFYALLTTFAVIVFLLTQLGWAEAVIYRTRREGVSLRRAFSTGILGNGVVCLAALLVCVVFREELSRAFLGDVSPRSFWLAAVTAPLFALGDLLRGVARALDRFDMHNQYFLLQSGGTLAALLVALPLAGGALDAALAAVLAVQVALVVGFGGWLGSLTGFEWRLDPGEALSSVAYGGKLYLQNLLIHFHERADVLLLAALGIAAFDIGLYAAAISVVAPLRLIPGALGTALLPRLAIATESDAAELTAAVVRPSIAVMFLCALGLGAVGAVAIPLAFGSDYAPAIAPFLVLLPGITAVTVSRLFARYFAAVGRPQALLAVSAVALLVNVGLNLLLIPRAGILGAALSSFVSCSFEAAATLALFLTDSGQSLRASLLPRRSDFEPYAARLRGLVSSRSR